MGKNPDNAGDSGTDRRKGSICIDGISLTVAEVSEKSFQVSVIPHTGEETTLLKKKSWGQGESGK